MTASAEQRRSSLADTAAWCTIRNWVADTPIIAVFSAAILVLSAPRFFPQRP